MKYTWILFDADGTLFDYDKGECDALAGTFAQFGLPFDPLYLALYHAINDLVWRDFERGTTTQERLKTERFARLFAAIGLHPAPDAAAFNVAYLDNLGDCADLLPGAETVVNALRGHVRLGLITNGLHSVQRPRLRKSAIGDAFEVVVVSEEVGASKPGAAIFDAAFALMGQPRKEDVLIVGDSLTSDIRGGSDYGIDTCWLNPTGRPRPEDLNIRYELRALEDLLPLIAPKLPRSYPLKNGATVVIRPAQPADAAAMLAYLEDISGETDNITFGPGEFGNTLAQEEAFIERTGQSDNSLMLVATVEERLVGTLTFDGGKRPRLRHQGGMGITVRRDCWGLGVGGRLMATLIAWARAGGVIRKINLHVREDNARAIALYQRFGFVVTGKNTRATCINGKFCDTLAMGLEVD